MIFKHRYRSVQRIWYIISGFVILGLAFQTIFVAELTALPSVEYTDDSNTFFLQMNGKMDTIKKNLPEIDNIFNSLMNKMIGQTTKYLSVLSDLKFEYMNQTREAVILFSSDTVLDKIGLQLGVDEAFLIQTGIEDYSNTNFFLSSGTKLDLNIELSPNGQLQWFLLNLLINGMESEKPIIITSINTLNSIDIVSISTINFALSISEVMINEIAYSIRGNTAWKEFKKAITSLRLEYGVIQDNTELLVEIKQKDILSIFTFRLLVTATLVFIAVAIFLATKQTYDEISRDDKILLLGGMKSNYIVTIRIVELLIEIVLSVIVSTILLQVLNEILDLNLNIYYLMKSPVKIIIPLLISFIVIQLCIVEILRIRRLLYVDSSYREKARLGMLFSLISVRDVIIIFYLLILGLIVLGDQLFNNYTDGLIEIFFIYSATFFLAIFLPKALGTTYYKYLPKLLNKENPPLLRLSVKIYNRQLAKFTFNLFAIILLSTLILTTSNAFASSMAFTTRFNQGGDMKITTNGAINSKIEDQLSQDNEILDFISLSTIHSSKLISNISASLYSYTLVFLDYTKAKEYFLQFKAGIQTSVDYDSIFTHGEILISRNFFMSLGDKNMMVIEYSNSSNSVLKKSFDISAVYDEFPIFSEEIGIFGGSESSQYSGLYVIADISLISQIIHDKTLLETDYLITLEDKGQTDIVRNRLSEKFKNADVRAYSYQWEPLEFIISLPTQVFAIGLIIFLSKSMVEYINKDKEIKKQYIYHHIHGIKQDLITKTMRYYLTEFILNSIFILILSVGVISYFYSILIGDFTYTNLAINYILSILFGLFVISTILSFLVKKTKGIDGLKIVELLKEGIDS